MKIYFFLSEKPFAMCVCVFWGFCDSAIVFGKQYLNLNLFYFLNHFVMSQGALVPLPGW